MWKIWYCSIRFYCIETHPFQGYLAFQLLTVFYPQDLSSDCPLSSKRTPTSSGETQTIIAARLDFVSRWKYIIFHYLETVRVSHSVNLELGCTWEHDFLFLRRGGSCAPSYWTSECAEDLSSFAMDCQTKSRIVEMKAIKAFVPPFLKNGATQFTTATKLRVDSTCTTVSLKRSRYFSRPAPSKSHGTGPFIISEDHHKKNTYEGSRWSTGPDTQDSEGNELADETECSNDALNFPDIDKVLENYLLSYTCSNHVVSFMECVRRLRQIFLYEVITHWVLTSQVPYRNRGFWRI